MSQQPKTKTSKSTRKSGSIPNPPLRKSLRSADSHPLVHSHANYRSPKRNRSKPTGSDVDRVFSPASKRAHRRLFDDDDEDGKKAASKPSTYAAMVDRRANFLESSRLSSTKQKKKGDRGTVPSVVPQDEVPFVSVLSNALPGDIPQGFNKLASPYALSPNKPARCNCRSSKCLKLYCECFSAGVVCTSTCGCVNCRNDMKHPAEKKAAVQAILARNPYAFAPKITKTSLSAGNQIHNKGCNCRKSGCLKKYCECFEAGIMCTRLCKCMSCQNYNGSVQRSTIMEVLDRQKKERNIVKAVKHGHSVYSTGPKKEQRKKQKKKVKEVVEDVAPLSEAISPSWLNRFADGLLRLVNNPNQDLKGIDIGLNQGSLGYEFVEAVMESSSGRSVGGKSADNRLELRCDESVASIEDDLGKKEVPSGVKKDQIRRREKLVLSALKHALGELIELGEARIRFLQENGVASWRSSDVTGLNALTTAAGITDVAMREFDSLSDSGDPHDVSMELGSTYKLVSDAMAMSSGILDISTTPNRPGGLLETPNRPGGDIPITPMTSVSQKLFRGAVSPNRQSEIGTPHSTRTTQEENMAILALSELLHSSPTRPPSANSQTNTPTRTGEHDVNSMRTPITAGRNRGKIEKIFSPALKNVLASGQKRVLVEPEALVRKAAGAGLSVLSGHGIRSLRENEDHRNTKGEVTWPSRMGRIRKKPKSFE